MANRELTKRLLFPIVAPRCSASFYHCYATVVKVRKNGEVSERLKEHAWKVCIRANVSRVRIPPSPPFLFDPLFISIILFISVIQHRVNSILLLDNHHPRLTVLYYSK